MSHWSKSAFLAEEISLLVKHFGVDQVRRALAKVSVQLDQETHVVSREDVVRGQRPIHLNGTAVLESIRDTYPEKHQLLTDFLRRLRDRSVLPDSQDIRYFAQMIGLKEITGKSREDMIPKLIRFLIHEPIEKVRADIDGAANISEEQRKMGFSVLTDKLFGKS